MVKLSSIKENVSHPIHETERTVESTISDRLLHPPCINLQSGLLQVDLGMETSGPGAGSGPPKPSIRPVEAMPFG